MFKKLLLALMLVLTLAFSFVIFPAGPAYAASAVDINKADKAALESVTGIGPAMADRILAERKKGGAFKDWNDVGFRVKGIGPAASAKLSGAGLTVNGESTSATTKNPLQKASAGMQDKK